MLQQFANTRNALMGLMGDLLRYGQEVDSRNGKVKELINVCFTIYNPLQRCILVKHRNDSIFHKVAETLWVIAGRNDIDWLEAYLPQARAWADNGRTWRAGYGPRLRNYCGVDSCVDQIKECIKLLNKDEYTRRAVMSLYDPSRDFVESLDIPCNNWIHWLIRDRKLHMSISQRSSDIMWGFSGINTFEWSVLHQMMAFWTGSEVGSLTYFIGSLHLYDKHWDTASNIADQYATHEWYPYTPPLIFNTEFGKIDSILGDVFEMESNFRKGFYVDTKVGDPLIDEFVKVLKVYWMWNNAVDFQDIAEYMFVNPVWYDIDLAMIEWFCRPTKSAAYKLVLEPQAKEVNMWSSLECMVGSI